MVKPLTLSDTDLDSLIASYGLPEEIHNNNQFLSKTIQLAMQLTDTSYCYISLLGSKNQRILSSTGMKEVPIPRDKTLCQFTLDSRRPTIIQNLKGNEMTHELPVSMGSYNFYAGFPLINAENIPIGALCAMDKDNKEIDESAMKVLQLLADDIVNRLDTNRNLIQLIKNINENFEPADCSNYHCLHGELMHLQAEVVKANQLLDDQRKELQRSNKNLTNFAHRVAHDLKAPLRSINSFSTIIKKNLDDAETVYKAEHFEYINNSVLELNRTIDNLLNISKLKAESIQQEKYSISEILDKLEIIFSQDLKENEVEFIKPNTDVQIFGYPTLQFQLLQNLISNGIKYRDKSKSSFVKVGIETHPKFAKISVVDNGIGIAKEDLNDIFKPFKRVTTPEDVKGLGIGLDTCKMIVDDIGANLKVESTPGEGTSFSFDIPYA